MPDKEHVGYWKMWRQGWRIVFLGSVVFGFPFAVPSYILGREIGGRPVAIEVFLSLAGLVYILFGLPVWVWMLHKGALTNSSTYRYIPRGHETVLTRLRQGNPPSTNATEE